MENKIHLDWCAGRKWHLCLYFYLYQKCKICFSLPDKPFKKKMFYIYDNSTKYPVQPKTVNELY